MRTRAPTNIKTTIEIRRDTDRHGSVMVPLKETERRYEHVTELGSYDWLIGLSAS